MANKNNGFPDWLNLDYIPKAKSLQPLDTREYDAEMAAINTRKKNEEDDLRRRLQVLRAPNIDTSAFRNTARKDQLSAGFDQAIPFTARKQQIVPMIDDSIKVGKVIPSLTSLTPASKMQITSSTPDWQQPKLVGGSLKAAKMPWEVNNVTIDPNGLNQDYAGNVNPDNPNGFTYKEASNKMFNDPENWKEQAVLNALNTFNVGLVNAPRMVYKGFSKLSQILTFGAYKPENDKVLQGLDKAVNYYEGEQKKNQAVVDKIENPLNKVIAQGSAPIPSVIATMMAGVGLEEVLSKSAIFAPKMIQALAPATEVAKTLPAKELLNPMVKMLPFGAHAGAGYAREAENDGASYTQQVLYGIYGGMAEMLTEMPAFEGFLELAGKGTTKGTGVLLNKALAKMGAKNIALSPIGEKALEGIGNIAKEMIQEAAVDPITGLGKKAIYQPNMPWVGKDGVIDPSQMTQDAGGGASMAVMMNIVMTALGLPSRTVAQIRAKNRAQAILESGQVPTPQEVEALKQDVVQGASELTPEEKTEINKTADEIKIDKEDTEAAPKAETPAAEVAPQVQDTKATLPMAERDFDNVGNKNVVSYQQTNPKVKPYIQDEANIMIGELDRTIKATRGANNVNGENIGYGNQRVTSDTIGTILDTFKFDGKKGNKYDQVRKALEDIVADHGRENNALAKKIEVMIDDRLTNGYFDDIQGHEVPPNHEYIVHKANFDEGLAAPQAETKKTELPTLTKDNATAPAAETQTSGKTYTNSNGDTLNITGYNNGTYQIKEDLKPTQNTVIGKDGKPKNVVENPQRAVPNHIQEADLENYLKEHGYTTVENKNTVNTELPTLTKDNNTTPTETIGKNPWQMTIKERIKAATKYNLDKLTDGEHIQFEGDDTVFEVSKKEKPSKKGQYTVWFSPINENGVVQKDYAQLSSDMPVHRISNDGYDNLGDYGIKHQNEIKQAITEGKEIPSEVLNDYPNLKTSAAPQTELPTLTKDNATAPAEPTTAQTTQGNTVEPVKGNVVQNASNSEIKAYTNKAGDKLEITNKNGQLVGTINGRTKYYFDDEAEMEQYLQDNGYKGNKPLPTLEKPKEEEQVIEDNTPDNGMSSLESDTPEAPKESTGKENTFSYDGIDYVIENIDHNNKSAIVKPKNGLPIIQRLSFEQIKNKYGIDINGEVKPAPQAEQKPTIQKENQPEVLKLGRAGKAAYEKWGKNEYVNVDLDKPDNFDTKEWTKFFNWWYEKGLSGVEPKYYERPDTQINFPPYLETVAFDAGKKDAESKAKKEETKLPTAEEKPAPKAIEKTVDKYPDLPSNERKGIVVNNREKERVELILDKGVKVSEEQQKLLAANGFRFVDEAYKQSTAKTGKNTTIKTPNGLKHMAYWWKKGNTEENLSVAHTVANELNKEAAKAWEAMKKAEADSKAEEQAAKEAEKQQEINDFKDNNKQYYKETYTEGDKAPITSKEGVYKIDSFTDKFVTLEDGFGYPVRMTRAEFEKETGGKLVDLAEQLANDKNALYKPSKPINTMTPNELLAEHKKVQGMIQNEKNPDKLEHLKWLDDEITLGLNDLSDEDFEAGQQEVKQPENNIKDKKGEGEKVGENATDTKPAGDTGTRKDSNNAKTDNEKVQSEDVPKDEGKKNAGKVPESNGGAGNGETSNAGRADAGEQSDKGESDLSGNSTAQQQDIQHSVGNGERGTVAGDSTAAIGNFRITEEDNIGDGGEKTKYKNNVAAIKLLKQLEAEGRQATAEEQKILAKFVGWGGLKALFTYNDRESGKWKEERKELEELLTEEEYEAARHSTENAHYTSPTVIEGIYKAIKRLGFRKGNVLEPSMGIGNFFGLLPQEMLRSKLFGVELDSITGRLAKQLYPNANIQVTGFQNAMLPDDYMDLVVGNVPFANVTILEDKAFKKYKFFLHDYFIAKALQKVRAGGIIAVITSKGTMDKKNSNLRKYLSDKAEFIGAIRLPNNAFLKNAGTQVTTDLIFLRKLEEGEKPQGEAWLNLGGIPLPEEEHKYDYTSGKTLTEVPVNEYYINHPEMMLGNMMFGKSMYGSADETTLEPIEGQDLAEAFEKAIENLPEGIYKDPKTSKRPVKQSNNLALTENEAALKGNAYVEKSGKVYQRLNNELVEVKETKKVKLDNLKGMIKIRDLVEKLLNMEASKASDEELGKVRKQLNKAYDDFVAKFGLLSDKINRSTFVNDPAYTTLQALEVVDKKTGNRKKNDIFTKRVMKSYEMPEYVESAKDALPIVLNNRGYLDLEKIADLTKKSLEEVANDLKGLIYLNPNGTYELADEYLSGNVREKLRQAEAAAELDDKFKENVEALKAVQPEDIPYYDIKAALGTSWIPKDVISDFIAHLFDLATYQAEKMNVIYSPHTSSWDVNTKDVDSYAFSKNKMEVVWGTSKMDGLSILEHILNMRPVEITYKDSDGRTLKDLTATKMAQLKAEEIKSEFNKWLTEDTARRDRIAQLYNELYNSNRNREYNGDFLTMEGMNESVTLMEHQRNSIARIVLGGNTLLAKAVGAGKTFIMQGASMELKRLGLAHKPMHIIKNEMVESGQYAEDFKKLYPNANLLIATSEDFKKDNRKALFARIATGNWDAIVIGHSSFKLIGLSPETQEEFIREQIHELEEAILSAQEDNESKEGRWSRKKSKRGESRLLTDLEKAKDRLQQQLADLMNTPKDDNLTFEQMGIDALFVDEAHNFKKLPIYTKLSRVPGIHTGKSQMATDLYAKVRYVNKLNGGERNVIFASGTPISNSMSEMYVMQKYLQGDTLKKLGIYAFDAWASTFGEVTTSTEVTPTGRGFRIKQRFAKFINAPEVVNLFSNVADVFTLDMLRKQVKLDIPTLTGGEEEGKPIVVVTETTKEQDKYIDQLIERMEAISSGQVDPSQDNALLITTEGRKIALDQRLIIEGAKDDPKSKVNTAVKNIFKEWKAGTKDRTTQIIFSDLGVPKDKKKQEKAKAAEQEGEEEEVDQSELVDMVAGTGFDIYNDIKSKLIKLGVPAEEIAFIHDAGKDKDKKAQLLADFRAGKIRIIIGNTAKMGEGTNMQDRVAAMHHLDVPYRPSDVEQREGRMIRQGNMNKKVKVYRYATKGTFDSYMWQMIERKAKFIHQVMSGKVGSRETEDVDEVTMNASIMKAAASDNPLIGELVEVGNKLQSLEIEEKGYKRERWVQERSLQWDKEYKSDAEKTLANLEHDKEIRDKNLDKENFSIQLDGKVITDKKEAGKKLLKIFKSMDKEEERNIGKFAGFTIKAINKVHLNIVYHNIELSAGGETYSIYGIDNEDGAYIRFNNALGSIEKDIEEAKKLIKSKEDSIKGYEEVLKKGFGKTKELDELRLKKKELENTIEAQMNGRGRAEIAAGDTTSNDTEYARSGASNGLPTPKGNGTVGKVKSKKQILTELEDTLGIPFRTGRVRGNGILGLYKRQSHVVRTKIAGDLDTAAHEAGHHLDNIFGMRDEVRGNTEITKELKALGDQQSKDPETKRTEGIAEFVRLYMTNETEAKQKAPKFYKYFTNKISSDTSIVNLLGKFREDYADILNATDEAYMNSRISVGEHDNKKLPSFEKLMQTWIDELKPLETYVGKITNGVKLAITDNPFKQAWLFRGWQNKAIAALKYGIFDENMNKVSKSLEEILKPVSKDLNHFRHYITARRALELWNTRGIDSGIDIARANRIVSQYGSTEFETAMQQLQDYNDALLQKLVDSGVLSEDKKNAIQQLNQDYVPLYRMFDKNNAGKGFGRKGFADLNNPVKGIKGSQREIIDPIESIVRNTYYFINMAERNNVGLTFVRLAEKFDGMGKYIERVTPKMKAQSFQVDEITKALEAYGADMTNVDPEELLTIFRPIMTPSAKENIVTVFRNGNQELYQLDPDLYRAMLSLDEQSSNVLSKIASFPASILRAGATLDPNFITRNPVRDAFSAMIYSKYGFVPVFDTVRGLFHVMKQDEMYQKFVASGAAGATMVSLDRNYLQKNLKEMIRQHSRKANAVNLVNPATWLDAVRAISEALENATRVSEFSKGLKKEGSNKAGVQEAALAARDITIDFSRAGTAGKQVNKAVAFFNATLQGDEKLIRAWKEHPYKTNLLAMALITLPSILLWLLFHKDERIKELPEWKRNLYWNIPTKDKIISIPKPFELGLLYGSLPERVLDWAYDNDKATVGEWGKSFLDAIVPSGIPTGMVAPLEYMTNFNLFRKQPIENMGDSKVAPEERYDSNTSEFAKALGKLPTLFGMNGISPKKIDNTIASATGGLGKTLSNVVDAVVDKDVKGLLPSLSGTKGFTTTPYQSSRTVDKFYNELEASQRQYTAVVKKYKAAKGLTDGEYLSLVNDDSFKPDGISKEDYKKYKQLKAIEKSLDDLKTLSKQVELSPDVPEAKKKAFRDKLNLARVRLIENGGKLPQK